MYSPIKKRIMVVDDNRDITLALVNGIRLTGVEITTFNDPLRAVEQFKESPYLYDLIITDIRMPELDGFALYREVKTSRSDVPIWFLTSCEITQSELGNMSPSIHVHRLLYKPISILKMRELIRTDLLHHTELYH